MLRYLLVPASWIYGWVVHLRNYLFDAGLFKSEKFDVPIICVGNITVGGTGKTPMAEMIIGYMAKNHRVALLSRGYGRRTKGYLEVRTDSHYRDVGDEPLQIKQKFPDTVVAVCEKRAEGIRRLLHDHPEIDLVVMDDGFQHRYVEARINVVVMDYTRPSTRTISCRAARCATESIRCTAPTILSSPSVRPCRRSNSVCGARSCRRWHIRRYISPAWFPPKRCPSRHRRRGGFARATR